jgi:methionyl-tRNA formyltransferase
MRITILTNLDLASCIALNHLLPLISEHTISVFYSSQVGNLSSKSQAPFELQQIRFLEQTVLIQNIFPVVEKYLSTSNTTFNKLMTFNQLAAHFQFSLQPLNDINQTSGYSKLSQSQPDLLVSIRFGKILKKQAIAVAKRGVINLHSGILPNYQGVMAVFWAMLNLEKNYGTTLHWIDSDAIDAGPIIKITQQRLERNKSYFENLFALYPTGAESIAAAIKSLKAGESIGSQQQHGHAQYFSFPTPQDLAQFNKQGLTLVDPAHLSEVYRQFG